MNCRIKKANTVNKLLFLRKNYHKIYTESEGKKLDKNFSNTSNTNSMSNFTLWCKLLQFSVSVHTASNFTSQIIAKFRIPTTIIFEDNILRDFIKQMLLINVQP